LIKILILQTTKNEFGFKEENLVLKEFMVEKTKIVSTGLNKQVFT